jgi:hypothetical protein
MLGRAREIEAFEGTLRVRVLLPEDIIGLKVQSLANDPSRERLREYFALFDRTEIYEEIRERCFRAEQG